MTPIKFNECNKHLDFPNSQSLDFFQDELTNTVIMLWQLTPEEASKIAETGQLYISQVFGQTAVPMLEVPFREITDDEKAAIELQRKKDKVEADREKRSRKPNAKIVKLK
jgi:hypothetical protein